MRTQHVANSDVGGSGWTGRLVDFIDVHQLHLNDTLQGTCRCSSCIDHFFNGAVHRVHSACVVVDHTTHAARDDHHSERRVCAHSCTLQPACEE